MEDHKTEMYNYMSIDISKNGDFTQLKPSHFVTDELLKKLGLLKKN